MEINKKPHKQIIVFINNLIIDVKKSLNRKYVKINQQILHSSQYVSFRLNIT